MTHTIFFQDKEAFDFQILHVTVLLWLRNAAFSGHSQLQQDSGRGWGSLSLIAVAKGNNFLERHFNLKDLRLFHQLMKILKIETYFKKVVFQKKLLSKKCFTIVDVAKMYKARQY